MIKTPQCRHSVSSIALPRSSQEIADSAFNQKGHTIGSLSYADTRGFRSDVSLMN